ncbi:hypothetical protein PT277_04500 [Acetobacteraceae bacterium ESL0709]|nr:hypothetical protein [Acetobacteraceae bacterium ESL0697]MDF7677957.1 hypothetical protein [Acetobacteraceae bacterium ESL0709]
MFGVSIGRGDEDGHGTSFVENIERMNLCSPETLRSEKYKEPPGQKSGVELRRELSDYSEGYPDNYTKTTTSSCITGPASADYPPEAQEMGREGHVILHCGSSRIDREGHIHATNCKPKLSIGGKDFLLEVQHFVANKCWMPADYKKNINPDGSKDFDVDFTLTDSQKSH